MHTDCEQPSQPATNLISARSQNLSLSSFVLSINYFWKGELNTEELLKEAGLPGSSQLRQVLRNILLSKGHCALIPDLW